MTAPLLIEIGLEELPPRAMRALGDQFAAAIVDQLDDIGIPRGNYQRFATPRRLAVLVESVAVSAPSYEHVAQGPSVDIAFDDDAQPTHAAAGFARKQNTTVDALNVEETDKGQHLVARHSVAGPKLGDCFNTLLNNAVAKLTPPKRMRWSTNTASFVRPVHWLAVVHGDQHLAATLFDVTSDPVTYGHRFHHPEAIPLLDANRYSDALREAGYVVADPDERASSISQQIQTLADSCGGSFVSDDELVGEINALVEFPVALIGQFDSRYLELPREVLIATMEDHQRYLPLQGSDGQLMNRFITVANLNSKDPDQVVAGNERVIRPRLDDALFFWNQDQKRGLDSLVSGLDRVQFEQSLGSLGDKRARIAQIARDLAPIFGVDPTQSDRIAELAKTDLLTEMVDEFSDLQGIMGGYYAALEGEETTVASAITTQYQPVGASGPIPETAAGCLLALADRLDTLAGIFAVNKRPTGDKDPYALRRAAFGVVRLLIESNRSLDWVVTLEHAVSVQPVVAPEDTVETLWMFHVERLRSYFVDNGTEPRDFDAVVAVSSRNPVDVAARVRAVSEFRSHRESATVYEAHKRIRNILKKQGGAPDTLSKQNLQADSEIELANLLAQTDNRGDAGVDYATALSNLTRYAEPLATFFDNVRIVVDDTTLRNNRLALLAAIDREFQQVADISELAG